MAPKKIYRIRGTMFALLGLVLFAVAGWEVARGFVRVGPRYGAPHHLYRATDPGAFWENIALVALVATAASALSLYNFRRRTA